ncbi:Ras-like protein family member 12, partial [Fragariocoptes setiger]
MSAYSPNIKILVLGARKVGKSATIVRFLTHRFIGQYNNGDDWMYRQHVSIGDFNGVTMDVAEHNETLSNSDIETSASNLGTMERDKKSNDENSSIDSNTRQTLSRNSNSSTGSVDLWTNYCVVSSSSPTDSIESSPEESLGSPGNHHSQLNNHDALNTHQVESQSAQSRSPSSCSSSVAFSMSSSSWRSGSASISSGKISSSSCSPVGSVQQSAYGAKTRHSTGFLHKLQWADAFVIVYSIDDAPSFKQASHYFHLIEHLPRTTHAFSARRPILLLANKRDLDTGRQVPSSKGRVLAIRHKCLFSEISAALSNQGICATFKILLTECLSAKSNIDNNRAINEMTSSNRIDAASGAKGGDKKSTVCVRSASFISNSMARLRRSSTRSQQGSSKSAAKCQNSTKEHGKHTNNNNHHSEYYNHHQSNDCRNWRICAASEGVMTSSSSCDSLSGATDDGFHSVKTITAVTVFQSIRVAQSDDEIELTENIYVGNNIDLRTLVARCNNLQQKQQQQSSTQMLAATMNKHANRAPHNRLAYCHYSADDACSYNMDIITRDTNCEFHYRQCNHHQCHYHACVCANYQPRLVRFSMLHFYTSNTDANTCHTSWGSSDSRKAYNSLEQQPKVARRKSSYTSALMRRCSLSTDNGLSSSSSSSSSSVSKRSMSTSSDKSNHYRSNSDESFLEGIKPSAHANNSKRVPSSGPNDKGKTVAKLIGAVLSGNRHLSADRVAGSVLLPANIVTSIAEEAQANTSLGNTSRDCIFDTNETFINEHQNIKNIIHRQEYVSARKILTMSASISYEYSDIAYLMDVHLFTLIYRKK